MAQERPLTPQPSTVITGLDSWIISCIIRLVSFFLELTALPDRHPAPEAEPAYIALFIPHELTFCTFERTVESNYFVRPVKRELNTGHRRRVYFKQAAGIISDGSFQYITALIYIDAAYHGAVFTL